MRRIDRSLSPPNWSDRLTALVLIGTLILVGGIVYFVAQALVAVARGSVPAALTGGGLAVLFCGFAGALSVTLWVPAERYSDWSGAGTTVRVNPAIAWCYGIALIGGVVGSSSYLVFVSRGIVDLPFASSGGWSASRYLMAALLALSVVGLIALLRSREPGYLRIGVNGVEHADMVRTRTAPWDDIVDITDEADKRTRNPIVFVVRDAKPVVVPNADRYASSGAALYWMARHYWQHSGDRDELTDGRALDRLRNGQFDSN